MFMTHLRGNDVKDIFARISEKGIQIFSGFLISTLTLQKFLHSISLPGVGWVPDPPAKNGEGEAVS
jgi:hypothetical protein